MSKYIVLISDLRFAQKRKRQGTGEDNITKKI